MTRRRMRRKGREDEGIPTEKEAKEIGWRQVAKRQAIIEIRRRIYGGAAIRPKKKETNKTRKGLEKSSGLDQTPEDEEMETLINKMGKEVERKADKAAKKG